MSRAEIAVIWTAYCTLVISVAGLLIWLNHKVKAKISKKYRKIQPSIEIYTKNYKRVHKNKFDKAV
jgi:hypothetical protein